jgi:hypothetical protein
MTLTPKQQRYALWLRRNVIRRWWHYTPNRRGKAQA